MTIIPLKIDFQQFENYSDQQDWLQENNIVFSITTVKRQALGFPKGWTCDGPAIEFQNQEDAMAFKLRWC